MEFLESTNFFVRVTVYDFEHRDMSVNLIFRLIPMVHIGEQSFSDTALEKILECDELIYEGMRRKREIRFINSLSKLGKKLGLVLQRDALNFKNGDLVLIHGDYSEDASKEEWKKVRFFEKLNEKVVIPVKRYFEVQSISRESMAKLFMKSYQEYHMAYGPRFDEPGTISNYYYAAREKIVFDIISQKIERDSGDEKTIGILYGAGHMNRISRNLIDVHGYHPSSGQFIKVFGIS